jgi:hypothetical protein
MSIPTIYISGDIQIGKTRRCIAFLNEIISKLEKNVSYLN